MHLVLRSLSALLMSSLTLGLLFSSAVLTPCLLRDPVIPEHCSLSKSHSAIQWNSISMCFYGRLAERMYNIPYGALYKRS